MAKAPTWARLTLILGAVLVLVAGVAVVGARWLIGSATGAVVQRDLLGDTQKAKSWTVVSGGDGRLAGPIDLLLMGVDARARWAVDDLRADTIIVLHIPAAHDRAYLVSIPRDTEMRVPAFARSGYPGGVAKANEAFFYGAQHGGGWAGGAQLMAKTIKANTGMSFDGAAIIDFNGFKSVIDALHGVPMCVDQRVMSHHMVWVAGKPTYLADARRSGKPQKPIWHEIGCKNMAGWEALDYSRQRYGLKNGDYDRQRHQQQLIKAIAKKATSAGVLANPLRVNQLMKAAGGALVLDTGGVPVTDFVLGLSGAAKKMVLLRTNDGTYAGNRRGRETLTPESREMFTAVRFDRLAQFVTGHPGVIATAH
jgi:LCP family protein required for cell wall assembly